MSGMNKKPVVNNPNEDVEAVTSTEDLPSNRFLSKDTNNGSFTEELILENEKVRSLGPSFGTAHGMHDLNEEIEEGVGDDEEGPDKVVTVSCHFF